MTAKRDNNNVPTITALLDSDGSTVTAIRANPSTMTMYTEDSSGGSDNGGTLAGRDGNYVTTLVAVSDSDGATPIPLYVNSSGELLIKSS